MISRKRRTIKRTKVAWPLRRLAQLERHRAVGANKLAQAAAAAARAAQSVAESIVANGTDCEDKLVLAIVCMQSARQHIADAVESGAIIGHSAGR